MPEVLPTPVSLPKWTLAERIGFRLLIVYVFLTFLPAPFDTFVWVAIVRRWDSAIRGAIVPWMASHVLRIPDEITARPNGSGDTTFNYVEIVCIFIASGLVTVVWSVLDRRRESYGRLADVLRTFSRYALATIILRYGLQKILPMQFQALGGVRLSRPLGSFSPMGLVWAFMGASPAYAFFGGVGECAAGLLLLFRRTTTLGALVGAAVLANVVALNFTYDIPVKLLSSQLLLLCLFLIAPDARRLADVLIFHRPTTPGTLRGPRGTARVERVRLVAKLVVLCVIFGTLAWRLRTYWLAGPGRPKPALFGLYEIDSFTRDGQLRPPLLDDPSRWRRVFVGSDDDFYIEKMDDSWLSFDRTDNLAAKTFTVTSVDDGADRSPVVLSFAHPDGAHLVLEGKVDGAAIVARGTLKTSFPLTDRGFHWVNEHPYSP